MSTAAITMSKEQAKAIIDSDPNLALVTDMMRFTVQSAPDSLPIFPYIYVWDRKGRKGQRCRTLRRGGFNSAAIEFEDGYQMVSSRNALRRAPEFADSVENKREKEVAEIRQSRRGTQRQAKYPALPDKDATGSSQSRSAVEARSGSCDISNCSTQAAEETK